MGLVVVQSVYLLYLREEKKRGDGSITHTRQPAFKTPTTSKLFQQRRSGYLSCWLHKLISPRSVQNMATFSSTINRYPVNTLYDCQSLISTVSTSFSHQTVLRWGKAGTPVAVVMTRHFSCLVNLLPGPVNAV